MEDGLSIIDKIAAYLSQIKSAAIEFLRSIPVLDNVSDITLQWIIIGFFFFLSIAVIIPLIKWSVKVSLIAVALSGILAVFTSYSFWGILPFTALGTAILLFVNKA